MGLVSFERSGSFANSKSFLLGNTPYVPPVEVEYLVIAGGGPGGANTYGAARGGGGAGGYRSSVSGESSGGGASAESPLVLSVGDSVNITVGAGGAGITANSAPGEGNDSNFHTIVSNRGGRNPVGTPGSGFGATSNQTTAFPPRDGTAGQGFAGGLAVPAPGGSQTDVAAGGGGGASQAGGDATISNPGVGGDGVTSSITGSAVTRAGGGGATSGGSENLSTPGGSGGGSAGINSTGVATSSAGGVNTGGGSGAAVGTNAFSGNGGSGIVILRYPSDKTITIGAGLTANTTTVGANKVTEITAGTGNVSFS